MNPSSAPFISALLKAIWDEIHIAIIIKIQKSGFPKLVALNMLLSRIPPDSSKDLNKLTSILSLFISCTRDFLNTVKEWGRSIYSDNIKEAVPLNIGPNPINKFPIL